MEPLTNSNTGEYNFSLWLRLLGIIAIIIIVLFLVLRINETVEISRGQIVAVNPPVDYHSSLKGRITKIYVKKGQYIKTGDTLLLLNQVQETKMQSQVDDMHKKLDSIDALLAEIKKKKIEIDKKNIAISKKYQVDISKVLNKIKTINQKYLSQKAVILTLQEKDSIRDEKRLLSPEEFDKSMAINLAETKIITALQKQQNKYLDDQSLVYNDSRKRQNLLSLAKRELDKKERLLLQEKSNYKNHSAIATKQNIEHNFSKQNIIATNSGIVEYLYDTTKATSLLSKNDLLVTVIPENVAYYAQVMIAEKDMPSVKEGSKAQLKLHANDQVQNGLLEGRLHRIYKPNDNNKFSSLINIPNNNHFKLRSGYTLSGKIIIQRLSLYKYFIKKLSHS